MLMCFYLFIESFLQNSVNYKTKLNYRVCNISSPFFQVLDFYIFHFYLTITLKTYQKCSYN